VWILRVVLSIIMRLGCQLLLNRFKRRSVPTVTEAAACGGWEVLMDEAELDAWVAEMLAVVKGHCGCGCFRNPLMGLRLKDRLRMYLYAVQGLFLPSPPAETARGLTVLDDDEPFPPNPGELPEPPGPTQ